MGRCRRSPRILGLSRLLFSRGSPWVRFCFRNYFVRLIKRARRIIPRVLLWLQWSTGPFILRDRLLVCYTLSAPWIIAWLLCLRLVSPFVRLHFSNCIYPLLSHLSRATPSFLLFSWQLNFDLFCPRIIRALNFCRLLFVTVAPRFAWLLPGCI